MPAEGVKCVGPLINTNYCFLFGLIFGPLSLLSDVVSKTSYFNCHQIYIRICPVFLKTHSRGHMSLQTNWMLFIKAPRKRGNRFHAFPMFSCGWGSLLKTFFRFICLGVNVCLTVYTFDLTDWEEEQYSSHIHPAGETPDSTKPKISFLSFFFSQQRFRRRSRTNKLLNIYWGRFGIHNRVPSKENSFLKPGQ